MAPTTSKKRVLDDASTPKSKKTKVDDSSKKSKAPKQDKPLQPASNLLTEDIDFPRGGGTTFTPVEVKAIRAEAAKEAEDEIFQVIVHCYIHNLTVINWYIGQDQQVKQAKRTRRKSEAKTGEKKSSKSGSTDAVRVEHLNYKVCLLLPYTKTSN